MSYPKYKSEMSKMREVGESKVEVGEMKIEEGRESKV